MITLRSLNSFSTITAMICNPFFASFQPIPKAGIKRVDICNRHVNSQWLFFIMTCACIKQVMTQLIRPKFWIFRDLSFIHSKDKKKSLKNRVEFIN